MDVAGMDYRRSGQIPAFGDWDKANELPITKYFESARQAGLVRYSSSSGESDPHVRVADLYSCHSSNNKPARRTLPSATRKTTKGREKRCSHVKEKNNNVIINNSKRQGKVCDVTEQPSKPKIIALNDTLSRGRLPAEAPPPAVKVKARPSKPVDEDLYKIPPELLKSSNRKRRLGFLSRCLVPAACAS